MEKYKVVTDKIDVLDQRPEVPYTKRSFSRIVPVLLKINN